MRQEYDFSNATKNPYVTALAKHVTIREDHATGDLIITFDASAMEQLRFKEGNRLVWTINATGLSVKKRTKRYRLREGEFESFLVPAEVA